MLSYQKLKTNPRRFLALTGLTPHEFQLFLPAFTRAYERRSARSRTAGTDRRRPRPKNAERQALHYTGKKKTHTDKNVLLVTRSTKRIAFLSPTQAGSMSGKKVAEQAQITYPRGTRLHNDLGFEGYEPRAERTYQPKKSRKVIR